ncbi:hypothetical protein GCM10008025_25660 [Ornithinibacillus halotolerans]|uniref:Uncharacterized protein n=1 Tax=Ornithinibacillus halotolerans TaxID=1274357 RepID=A0A916WAS4_9BACI|nr:hypothetical protein GCM10008025_25660 [Ornithinibacillus halotolerans]
MGNTQSQSDYTIIVRCVVLLENIRYNDTSLLFLNKFDYNGMYLIGGNYYVSFKAI